MLVALLTFGGDIDNTIKLLQWMAEIGGCPGHDLVIVADAGTPFGKVNTAREIARDIFNSVDLITNAQSIIGWVEGPKSLVRNMIHYGRERNQPWLLMDSDAVPLRDGWLDIIQGEYESCGKEYMGHVFGCQQPGLPKLLMSPIAVYPPTADELLPAIDAGHHWDVSMTEVALPKCHNTTRIQHFFGEMGNPPTFAETAVRGTNIFDLNFIHQNAVVFHRNKDFTLIDLLRRRMGNPSQEKPKDDRQAFFQMGRFGDLILLMPAYRYWAEYTGQPAVVFTSEEFGSVLDGASYVQAMKLPYNWHLQAGEALRHATQLFPDVIRTQLHGVGLTPATPDTLASYSLSMWERTGLLNKYAELPLVFDRRSPERELELVKKWKRTDKPLLLVNFDGATSPYRGHYEMIARLMKHANDRFEVINTNEARGYRIYDLLGLMDVAAGLITIDTATLHLAAAAKCPYIALVRSDGQAGSIPKGNVALKLGYDEALSRFNEIAFIVDSWIH